MAGPRSLCLAVTDYLERVVNRRDVAHADEVLAASYRGRGHGWPETRTALLDFYAWQAAHRPDWRIEVQGCLTVDRSVVVHALAGGTVTEPSGEQRVRRVEWLAAYTFEGEQIAEIEVLALRDL